MLRNLEVVVVTYLPFQNTVVNMLRSARFINRKISVLLTWCVLSQIICTIRSNFSPKTYSNRPLITECFVRYRDTFWIIFYTKLLLWRVNEPSRHIFEEADEYNENSHSRELVN